MNKIIITCIVYSVLFIGGLFVYSFFKDGKEVKVEEGESLIANAERNLSNGKVSHDEEYEFSQEAVAAFQKNENNVDFLVAVLSLFTCLLDLLNQFFSVRFLPNMIISPFPYSP
ncbi:hypothetical protein [Neobacillus jeddahensis]|uniref:hypothetical protein n=1 Tax=Neobacillus jeddahensis TaxID=1461580 RepID=UPI00058AC34F|nr:hypothetical protein [Neobacillus jeddahensis]